MFTSDQVLLCIQELENPEDKNAVALMNKEKIVGHVPCMDGNVPEA